MSRVGKKKAKRSNETWKYIKKCIPYFLIEKKALVILLLLSFSLSMISAYFPSIIGKVLNLITQNELNSALTLAVISVVIFLVYDYLNKIPFIKSFVKVRTSVTSAIKNDVVDAYFEIDNKHLIKTPSGVFLTRITHDPENITSAFDAIRSNISTIISNLFVVFYIMYINIVLGMVVLIGTILIYIVEKQGMNKWNKYVKIRNKDRDTTTSIINEGVKGIHDIKVLNISDYFKSKIGFHINKMKNDEYFYSKIDARYEMYRDAIIDIFTFVVIVLSIYFLKYNVISLAGVITLFMYKERMFSSILYIAWSERHLKNFLLSAKRIFEVVDYSKYKKEVFGQTRVNYLSGNIEFKNVYFSYNKETVLKGINLKIQDKDTIAIVGRSGSGKTTIINLLDKLYTIDKGKILIDGYNINDLDKYSLRNNISIIPQDPYLFNVTIKENLKMVKTEATQKQIENVCKICEIHDYIMTLPQKYNTVIGEGGVNLSGGEKQRLAIARALLKRTNIILFDEATSALDNETQYNIQKAINNISSEYTMLIVAHRLSTIKDCNKIVVIDKGKVVGIGTHQELLKDNEIYRTLYENELQK